MKNLFDFASKELSQDAFLLWLFESYEDPDFEGIVRSLLTSFCELDEEEQIKSIKSKAQWKKIDIKIDIETNKRTFTLFIEDKVFSLEHDQLKKYNDIINNEYSANKQIYKIFYKTAKLENREELASLAAAWTPYDINKIIKIFSNHNDTSNIILSQYIEHLEKIYNALNWIKKPDKNENWEDILKWISYFNNNIIPKMPKDFDYYVMKSQYSYVYLKIIKKGYDKIPYLEVRSRDCLNGNFKIKLLCYTVEDFSPQPKLIERIKKDGILECKHLTHKKGNSPKQIGYSTEAEINTDDEFIEKLIFYTSYYLKIIEDWK